MTHLQDKTKEHGIRCNRWTRGFARITEDATKVDCSTCLGKKRAPNRYQSIDINGMNLVGKILHKSWGYNMTLNTYYLITKQDAKSVVAHEIGSKVVETTGYMSGREMPDPTTPILHTDYSVEVKENEAHPRAIKNYRFIAKGTAEHLSFVGGGLSHSLYNWLHDGQPNYFNHCD